MLLIAATNFPEKLDEAVLGGGWLTEKVMFGYTDATQRSEVIDHRLKSLKIPIAKNLRADWLQSRVQGLTVGNITALLQNTVDQVEARKLDAGSHVIERADVDAAFTALFPDG